MRRIPIRVKLAAALAVPLVALILVTVLEIVDVAGDTRQVRAQTELASATMGPNSLLAALQGERAFAAAHLVGVDDVIELEVTGYDRTRADTDAALAEFRAVLDGHGDLVRSAYAPALAGIEAHLRQLRASIDSAARTTTRNLDNMSTTNLVFAEYTGIIEPFFGGMSRVADAVDDRELRQGGELMATFTRYKETLEQLHNAVGLAALGPAGAGDAPGDGSRDQIVTIAELRNAIRRYAPVLRSPAGRYAEIAERSFPQEYHQVTDDVASRALAAGSVDIGEYVAALAEIPPEDAYVDYISQLASAIEDRADELNASATARQRWFVVAAVASLGVAVVTTWLVSRSITRPLRTLTGQAKAMADQHLPEVVQGILATPLGEDVTVPEVDPVAVRNGDEIGDVAAALNTVQEAALHLAMEQAVLRHNLADSFVNLGRRNQNLLSRQLDFITELEASETDADTLADLFRLDHLATRMRRNAESLLVLGGVEPPRTWAAPVPLTAVIRAALGEVEDYQRVVVHGVEHATVVGSAAADVAHVLAELIENAVVFSPPDHRIHILGRRLRDGYTLAVVDRGLGMDPHEIATANRRLAGGESFTVAPSKYLGHYVAGNLAARHGISVHLTESPGGGTTAVVDLPPPLLTEDARPPSRAAVELPRGAGRPATGAASSWLAVPNTDQLVSLARVTGWNGAAERRAIPAATAPPTRGRPRHGWPPPGTPAAPPLPRRVQGMQMPETVPLRVQRSPGAAAPGRPGGDRSLPASPPNPAEDLYSFLSSFTAGVVRGLDEAATRRRGPRRPG